MLGKDFFPIISGEEGFTGYIGRVFGARRLFMIRPPQLTGLFEAPITATDSGLKRLFQTSSDTKIVLLSGYGRLT
jgi:hypothetical protein